MHPLYCAGIAEMAMKTLRFVAALAVLGLALLLVYGSVYAGTTGLVTGTPQDHGEAP